MNRGVHCYVSTFNSAQPHSHKNTPYPRYRAAEEDIATLQPSPAAHSRKSLSVTYC